MTEPRVWKYPEIERKAKEGSQPFTNAGVPTPFMLGDFWKWTMSDLVSNATRGILAEFIVAQALGIDTTEMVRRDWDDYDLVFDEMKVEVKSCAYWQSWGQDRMSRISFGVAPSEGVEIVKQPERKRRADIYVFALLAHQERATLDPMDLSQWRFYVVPTSVLNEKVPQAKSVSLEWLGNEVCVPVRFGELRTSVERVRP